MRWAGIGLVLGTAALPLSAQQPSAPSPAEMFDAQKRMFLPPPPARNDHCTADRDTEPGDIVVCGRVTDSDRYRVPSSGEDAPLSNEARRTGMPHVSQSAVTNMVDCSPSSGNHCRAVGRAPAPIYYIDLSKIPEAPPGSDADKIAKGEMRAP